jgi:crossover junction endonuclease MUS81
LTSAKLPAESPLFVLRPGHFDVVLIVDNCETNAKSHFRGVLLKELSKYGVKFQVRKLQVGDFLWVAQENVSHLPGQLSLPKAREIVLEHIVERKRMDDLASSIIDKRFGEQKFRLSNCGLTRPIYLVESYGDAAHFSIPEKSLMQAIANTQVTEGFHIVTTGNIQESVAYLTFMTRYIQSIYLTMSLEAHSMEYFSHHHNGKSGVRLPGSSGIRLMEFSEFNEAAIKNKALQITEMFAKQLMQIPGVSVDKAAAIVQLYKTPVELFEAYESCSTDKDKVMLLARVKSGHANRYSFTCASLSPSLTPVVSYTTVLYSPCRNFGPMLSRRICSLFHSQTNS